MKWLRSIVAIGVGVVVAAGLARYVGLPILVTIERMFVPQVDSVVRPEPAHPLIYYAASLAAIGSCFMAGGLVAAFIAPLQPIRHAMAAGLLVGALTLAVGYRPAGTPTPTAWLAFIGEVVAFTTIAGVLGGFVGSRVAERLATPTSA